MSESLKTKSLILIVTAGILFTCINSMPLVMGQPKPTSITIAVPSEPQWKTCTIEATLKDDDGNPLQNFDIDFLYECFDQADYWHPLGTAKTNSNGVASLTYTFPIADTWNVTAKFSGTSYYAKSSSEYLEIIIIEYTPYLVGGGIIAVGIMCIAGYVVFRRRKKAITKPMTTKGEKKMRINPLQIGFSITIGWTIVFAISIIQSIINPSGRETFWAILILGLSFIGLGFIKKEEIISTQKIKTILQIGVVVTTIWVMSLFQMEGPYDLGLPKIYVPTGYTPNGVPTGTPLLIILFLSLPVLGLTLLVWGIVLNRRKKS